MSSRYALTCVGSAALMLAWTGTARAIPAYAFAEINIQNFSLTGVVGANGQPLPGVTDFTSSVTSTDGANYPGAVTSGNSAGGSLSTGTDPTEATSGPGPFPGQNVFTQALLPPNTLSPNGTRADALVTGSIASGSTVNLVSEGKLSNLTNAGSNSGISETIQATFATANTINLTFAASSSLAAQVAMTGDSANAQTSVTFKVFDVTTGQFVTITDNINAANDSTTIAPAALNRNVATTDPSGPQSFSSALAAYSFSATLRAGDTYQITIADSTTDILQSAILSTVPEPRSLAMFAVGLAALGLTRRPRRKL